MGALLALLAALAYGTSDFAAGVASRRLSAGPVTVTVQACGLAAAGVAVLLFPGAGPAAAALSWGAASGIGSAAGTLSLYQGPCTDWDLHTLVNHVIRWTAHSAERRARDEPLPEELMNRDFASEPGFADGYAAQLDRAVAAWSEPGAWEGERAIMGSPAPAADVGAGLIAEMVLHGWDVARAIGEEYRAPDALASAVYRTVEANAELFRKYQGFAEPVQVPASAPVPDRALALSGRDPAWAPGG